MYFAYRECPKLFTYLNLETKAVGKTCKKASWTQGVEFLSVRKKVRPSAGKFFSNDPSMWTEAWVVALRVAKHLGTILTSLETVWDNLKKIEKNRFFP